MIAALLGAVAVAALLDRVRRPPARHLRHRTAVAPSRPSAAEGLARLVTAGSAVLDRIAPTRIRIRRDAQLPDALERLASALRAGRALGPALGEVAGPLPNPLGDELRQMAAAVAHGASTEGAAATWASQPGSSADVRLVAAALGLGASSGGEVARAVDRVAATLRERRELAGEVRSLATQARASAGVLALAPLAFTALVATIEPSAAGFLVTSPVGAMCLVLGLALQAAGAVWMARITRGAS